MVREIAGGRICFREGEGEQDHGRGGRDGDGTGEGVEEGCKPLILRLRKGSTTSLDLKCHDHRKRWI